MTFVVIYPHDPPKNLKKNAEFFSFVKFTINDNSELAAMLSIVFGEKKVYDSFIFDRNDCLNITKNNGITLF